MVYSCYIISCHISCTHLFRILTKDIVKEEIREFVRAEFLATIQTLPDKRHLINAWEELLESGVAGESAMAQLKLLDISSQKQSDFMHYMLDKYEEQFDEELKEYVRQGWLVEEKRMPCHAVKYGGVLYSLLEQEEEQEEKQEEQQEEKQEEQEEEGGAEESKGN